MPANVMFSSVFTTEISQDIILPHTNPILDILSTLGQSFLTNRTATLFILTLPVIGLCERMGLRDKAVDLIKGLKGATTGRLLAIWQTVRTVCSAFSLRIGGHPQFIRPLINPMAQAAAIAEFGENIPGNTLLIRCNVLGRHFPCSFRGPVQTPEGSSMYISSHFPR